MPVRKYFATSSSKYRYSINGQEKETELNENITTALYWEYDSRIARRWNIDPKQNVWESSYLCFGANPILLSDVYGDEAASEGNPKKKKTSTKSSGKTGYKPDKVTIKNPTDSRNPCSTCASAEIKKKRSAQSTHLATISQDKFPQGTPQSNALKEEYQKNKALVGATMDPFAGVVVNQISTTVYGVVTSRIKNSYQIYEGVQDNNIRQIALGSLGLALDLAPFVKVPGLAAAGKAEDMMTLTRTISGAEAESIIRTQNLSFGPNNQMKQFWLSEGSYETYINAADGRFANGYKLQIQVPKSSVGEGKLFNTSVQVDQGLFPINTINSTTLDGKAALDAANKNISSFTISKE